MTTRHDNATTRMSSSALGVRFVALLALAASGAACSKPHRKAPPKPAPSAPAATPEARSLVSPGGVQLPAGTPDAILALVDQLDLQRTTATSKLVALGAQAAPAMRALLASPSVPEQQAALKYFAETTDPSGAEGAALALASDVPSIRRQALLTLERVGAASKADMSKQLGPIVGRFQDPDAMVRSLAIRVATELGGVASTKPLVDLLADRDEQVTVEAALALARVLGGPEASDRRAGGDEPAGAAKAPAGAPERRAEVISALVRLVPSPRPSTAIGALTALGALGAGAPAEVVRAATHNADERVAVAALRLASRLPPGEAAPLVTGALGDPRTDVRRAAVEETSALSEDARREALDRATEDASAEVRAAALVRYAPLAKDPVAALLDALRDQEPLVRATAVLALSKVGPKATKPLVALLDTERDNTVRQALYRALKRLKAREAVPRLVALLQDPKTRTSNLVADALEVLTAQHLGNDARAWRRWLDAHGDGKAAPPGAGAATK